MAKPDLMIYHRKRVNIKDGKFVTETSQQVVRVLARAEGWAMVRPKGFATFCCPEKELSPIKEKSDE